MKDIVSLNQAGSMLQFSLIEVHTVPIIRVRFRYQMGIEFLYKEIKDDKYVLRE